MNKEEQVNEFLRRWAVAAIQNEGLCQNLYQLKDNIYHDLIFHGVSDEQKSIQLDRSKNGRKTEFHEWQDYYRNNPDIDVFVSHNWKYFCQFISKNPTASASPDHIKVYLPLDEKHIEIGTKLIFDFLTANNISHHSKVGKKIRFDNIVIRLAKKEDADSLLEFVKGNSYLQEGLIEPNPFAFQKDGIALACDGDESYNATVSDMIALYIADCKEKNRLSKVDHHDFYNFIATNYNDEFVDRKNNKFERYYGYQSKPYKKKNIQQIISLILKSSSNSFNYEEFIDHFEECAGKKQEKIYEPQQDVEKLLIEAIDGLSKRFQSYEGAMSNVEGYINSGDRAFITRNNGLRDKVTKSNMRESIMQAMLEYGLNFRQYASEVMERHGYNPIFRSFQSGYR